MRNRVVVSAISTSPLRYPGGKSRAVKTILAFIPQHVCRVCSPFMGGGSIELALAAKGVQVYGYDNFEPLVTFWRVLLQNPKGLMKVVQRYYPLPTSRFYALQKKYHRLKNKTHQAAVFYALNRASFSGTTFSGGMSLEHPRFTQKSIDKLQDFKVNNLQVAKADFTFSIAKHSNDFLYLDPPYIINAKLYGDKKIQSVPFNHEALAALLHKRERWILSYNDCSLVRKLYKGYRMKVLTWKYGMNTTKQSNELVIFSHDIDL